MKAKEALITKYKSDGRKDQIQTALKKMDKAFSAKHPSYPKALCCLHGEYKDQYLNDMYICQDYATINRETIARLILHHLKRDYDLYESFTTIHNYINPEDSILRKGAVSAKKGETLLIPMNMRDGSLLCIGKGNEDWNQSAPHGAGRLMSRGKAKESLSLEDYKKSMHGIYTTSVSQATLDEAPDAYKPMEEIISCIGDTVEIIGRIRPIYNFKASD